MKRTINILISALLTIFSYAQTVTNVQFEQVNNRVKITYSLDKTADISVCVSTDGGKTYSSPLKKVSGDVGKSVSAGSRTIWWEVLEERENIIGSNICFKVTPTGGNLVFTIGDVSFTMVYVEGGTFMMGATSEQGSDADSDEKPVHQVTLSDYYIGQTEVTQGLWQAVMGTNPSEFKKGNNYPVEQVTWNEATKFCRKLSKLTGRTFVLPTEAQWEYAARGGKKSRGYKYSGSNDIGSVAWYLKNSGSNIDYSYNSNRGTHPVATKSPNELGLYDMSGNVCEWCSDRRGKYSSRSLSNPRGKSGIFRVIRDGGWLDKAEECRVSHRSCYLSIGRLSFCGFRLVLLP